MIRSRLFIGLGLGLFVGFVLGCWLCNRGQAVTTTITTKVDTTKFYKPTPIDDTKRPTSGFALPRVIFAPADTVVKTIVVTERGDTTKVSFPVEQREYRDSSYYAIVSGAVVGDCRPTLDYIETYNTTTTSEVVLQPMKLRPYVGGSVGVYGEWSISVGGGLLIKDHHAVGAEYERTQSHNKVKLKYSYLF